MRSQIFKFTIFEFNAKVAEDAKKAARSLLSILFVLFFLAAGCAKPVLKITVIPQEVPSVRLSVKQLRSNLDKIFANPNFANAFWGVAIQSLDSGEILYEQNS